MGTKQVLVRISCLVYVIMSIRRQGMASAQGMYGHFPGFPISSPVSIRYKCQDLAMPTQSDAPYTPVTMKMIHITCDFCTTYNFSCKDRICQRGFARIGFASLEERQDLAHALCELCSHHRIACTDKFCVPKSENNHQDDFVRATCAVCYENNQLCAGQSLFDGLDTLLGIIDGPLWDFVLADDMLTSYLIAEVETGEWDDFLNGLDTPLSDYVYAQDTDYHYDGDELYDEEVDDIIYDDSNMFLDD